LVWSSGLSSNGGILQIPEIWGNPRLGSTDDAYDAGGL
jgi:hypothetical protein